MIVRRLLMAGGAGSFPAPAFASLGITGYWNGIAEPRAAYYNGKTHLVFVDDAGNIYAATFTHATGSTSSPFLIGSGFSSPSGDIHNSAAVCVRSSDRRLLAVELYEGEAQPYARVSTNPEDSTAWGAAYHILASGDYTYCSLYQLISGDVYLFLRSIVGGVFYLAYAKSTDGGATWSGPTSLITPVTGTGNPTNANYWRIGCDGTSFHLFVTDTDRSTAHPSSVYHLRFDGTTLYKTDGTSLGSSFPVAVTSGMLVQDASLGSCWPDGTGVDGNPACVLGINDANGSANTLVRHARWTGSAWSAHAVVSAGGLASGNLFQSWSAMARTDPYTLWVPVKIAGVFEVYRYTSSDSGATWSGAAVTAGSLTDNLAVDTPLDAAPGFRAIWAQGTYTSDSSFSLTVQRGI